jgi:hypothetical protein
MDDRGNEYDASFNTSSTLQQAALEKPSSQPSEPPLEPTSPPSSCRESQCSSEPSTPTPVNTTNIKVEHLAAGTPPEGDESGYTGAARAAEQLRHDARFTMTRQRNDCGEAESRIKAEVKVENSQRSNTYRDQEELFEK